SNAHNYECLETCSDVENISLLKTLAAVNFEKENVYGNHKEQLEPMFEKQVCPIYSLSNDETTYGSKIGKKQQKLFSKIHAPFAQYDERNDNENSAYHIYPNIWSCVSYFAFSVTDEVEKAIEKLKKVEWKPNF
ncbi:hypothetical protein TYRP_021630, partial [Tyrophagus putrescentiae]